jgi:hypothetical protein
VRGHISRLQPNGASPSRGPDAREPAARRAFSHSGFGIFGCRSRAPRPFPNDLWHCSTTTSSGRGRTGILGGCSRSPRHRGSVAARLCGACWDRSLRGRARPPRTSWCILGGSATLKRVLRPRSSGEVTLWSNQSMSGFCRDCLADVHNGAMRCQTCGSPRLLCHAELETLSIAHIDNDAFYAAVEKARSPGATRPAGDRRWRDARGCGGGPAMWRGPSVFAPLCRCSKHAVYARMP